MAPPMNVITTRASSATSRLQRSDELKSARNTTLPNMATSSISSAATTTSSAASSTASARCARRLARSSIATSPAPAAVAARSFTSPPLRCESTLRGRSFHRVDAGQQVGEPHVFGELGDYRLGCVLERLLVDGVELHVERILHLRFRGLARLELGLALEHGRFLRRLEDNLL